MAGPTESLALARASTDDVGDHPDTEWDAGDLSCGDLVLHLRFRMMAMAPGTVLRLVATDPGAPADIPAWCRLTGHTLIDTHPPVYLIRRKES